MYTLLDDCFTIPHLSYLLQQQCPRRHTLRVNWVAMVPLSVPLASAVWVRIRSSLSIIIVHVERGIGIGAFYGKTDQEEAFRTLTYAADHGITFWDCADIYGDSKCIPSFLNPQHLSYCYSFLAAEAVLGKWFTQTGRRSEIFLATKFGSQVIGAKPPRRSSAPSYIRQAVARSLGQLNVAHIDLYYQHRVDPNVPIEIVMQTLGELVEEGKIKYIGLSECSADTLRRAKAVKGVGDKLIAVQMEYGPFSLDIEHGDFMKAVEETGVAVVAYSPLCRGLASGRYVIKQSLSCVHLLSCALSWDQIQIAR
jgi:aryl-alcohol dehydrogenase-like predicted oxidoreductase